MPKCNFLFFEFEEIRGGFLENLHLLRRLEEIWGQISNLRRSEEIWGGVATLKKDFEQYGFRRDDAYDRKKCQERVRPKIANPGQPG